MMTDSKTFEPEKNGDYNHAYLSASAFYTSEPLLLSVEGLEKDSDWLSERLRLLYQELGLSKPEDLIAVVAQWAYAEKQDSLDKELTQIKKLLEQSVALEIMTQEEADYRLEQKRKELKKPPLLDALFSLQEQDTLYKILKDAHIEIETRREDIKRLLKLFFGLK